MPIEKIVKKAGLYWNPRTWEMEIQAGGVVSAEAIRVPTPLFVAIAPIMGALYVFFLPAVGLAVVAKWVVSQTRVLHSVQGVA